MDIIKMSRLQNKCLIFFKYLKAKNHRKRRKCILKTKSIIKMSKKLFEKNFFLNFEK